MRLLLDTHILLWFLSGDELLQEEKKSAILDTKNAVFVSKASLWEIMIKKSLGKITFDFDMTSLTDMLKEQNMDVLDLTNEHIAHTMLLPFHHRDPIDRMLVSQSICDKLTIVSEDKNFKQYPVTLL